MSAYTIFDQTTGRIIKSGFASSVESAMLQRNDGESIVLQASNWATDFVEKGYVKPFPPRPSASHDFNYTTKVWEANLSKAWEAIRSKRDHLLKDTDWLVTRAVETETSMPAGWATYRQALRDVTSQPDPMDIIWPTEPV